MRFESDTSGRLHLLKPEHPPIGDRPEFCFKSSSIDEVDGRQVAKVIDYGFAILVIEFDGSKRWHAGRAPK